MPTTPTTTTGAAAPDEPVEPTQRAPLTGAAQLTGTADNDPQPAAGDVTGDARQVAERITGTDLGDVPIHRAPRVDRAAEGIDARSFATKEQVYLPSKAGPTDSGEGRALLAHELTHVAQQRQYGPTLPSEDTPLGQSLERQAVKAERAASDDLPFAPPPAPADAVTAPATPGVQLARGPLSPESAPEAEPSSFDEPVQRAARAATPRAEPPAPVGTDDAGDGDEGAGEAGDGDDQEDEEMEELAKKLHDRLYDELRFDLLIERERAGFVTDL